MRCVQVPCEYFNELFRTILFLHNHEVTVLNILFFLRRESDTIKMRQEISSQVG